MNASTTDTPREEPLFGTLVMMLSSTALHHLGRGVEPGGEAQVDLRGAEAMIDLLEMLERKTQANRTERESRMLAAALTEVRMAFVQATEGAPPSGDAKTAPAAEPEAQPPAPEADVQPPGPQAPPSSGDGREPRYHKSYG